MAVELPSRLAKGVALKSAVPPSLSELDDNEEPRRILFDAFMALGPSLARLNSNRACDFTFATAQKQYVNRPKPVDNEFITVDTSRKGTSSRPSMNYKNGANKRDAANQGGAQNGQNPNGPNAKPTMHYRPYQTGGKKDKLGAAYQRSAPINRFAVMRARAVVGEYACNVESEWDLVADASIQFLNGTAIDPKTVTMEDIKLVGQLRSHTKPYDIVTPSTAVSVPVDSANPDRPYKIPGTVGDPILSDLIQKQPELNVVVTSQILSTLMASTVARFGWQVMAYKFGDQIILEKPDDNDILDLLTLNENVSLEQIGESKQRDAACESAKIQTQFQDFVLRKPGGGEYNDVSIVGQETDYSFYETIPIADNHLYRYRYVTLPPGRPMPGHQGEHCRKQPLKLAVRSEVHCGDHSDDRNHLFTVHCLTEGLVKVTGKPWSTALEKEKGTLLLNEMRRNSCKISKWIYQSVLAGAEGIKIGFVTRKNNNHQLLAFQTSEVSNMIIQIGLKMSNGWGVVRELLDIILSDTAHKEGKYIITRDALSETIKVHYTSIPEEEFHSPE